MWIRAGCGEHLDALVVAFYGCPVQWHHFAGADDI
jgi:hypothetical protein